MALDGKLEKPMYEDQVQSALALASRNIPVLKDLLSPKPELANKSSKLPSFQKLLTINQHIGW
jgi:hypothetical protein